MVTQIPLSSRKYPGLVALVDDEDAPYLLQFKWHVRVDDDKLYAARTPLVSRGERKSGYITMHRELLGKRDGVFPDHVNRNGLDNRRENLRFATPEQNNFNRTYRRRSSSGFRGVVWNRRVSRWQCSIKYRRKSIYLGLFDDPVEAACTYDAAAREYFGSFARLNFPRDGEQAERMAA